MFAQLRPAILLTALFTLLLGILYPLSLAKILQSVFPDKSIGSPIIIDNKIIGSALIGQNFEQDKYFHSRPSATSMPDPQDASKTIDAPYNATNSSGSNYGPLSQKLLERVKADLEKIGNPKTIAGDAVTSSASGLDPHVSLENATQQITVVARARKISENDVNSLVLQHVEGRWLGLIGEPRVNVLQLNLALDAKYGR
jgi:potassium-transporting ATPase KdpC subunit